MYVKWNDVRNYIVTMGIYNKTAHALEPGRAVSGVVWCGVGWAARATGVGAAPSPADAHGPP